MNPLTLWQRIQQGHLNNISLRDFCCLLKAFGFELARRGRSSNSASSSSGGVVRLRSVPSGCDPGG